MAHDFNEYIITKRYVLNRSVAIHTAIIESIFNTTSTIAIVGLSENANRPSNRVGNYLINNGFEVIPVNPNLESVLGQKCYPDLIQIPVQVDLVNIFRRSEYVKPVVEEAIRIGVKSVWMQDGVKNDEAAKLASDAGVLVIMDDCIYRQHKRKVQM